MNNNEIAVKVFNELADLYQEKYMNVDIYADTFDEFCAYLPENSNVLELACGPGNITKYVLTKRSDLQMLATDLAPNMVKLAQENNPKAKTAVLDCLKIGELSERFHGIMCGFCLPYLSMEEVAKMFQDVAQLLKENGVLYVSTMEDDYTKSAYKKGSSEKAEAIFMHYYQETDLREMLEESGLEVVSVSKKKYLVQDIEVVDLCLIAQKS